MRECGANIAEARSIGGSIASLLETAEFSKSIIDFVGSTKVPLKSGSESVEIVEVVGVGDTSARDPVVGSLGLTEERGHIKGLLAISCKGRALQLDVVAKVLKRAFDILNFAGELRQLSALDRPSRRSRMGRGPS